MNEDKNMVELKEVGDCLLHEVCEIEDYQKELVNEINKCKKELEIVHEDIEKHSLAWEKIQGKIEQILECMEEYKDDKDMLDVFSKKNEKNIEEMNGIKAKLQESKIALEKLNNIYNTSQRQYGKAEYGKNILLAFGTKYGFLIKKPVEGDDEYGANDELQ